MPLFHSGVTAISLKQTEHIFPGKADKFTPSQVPVKPAAIRIYQQRGGHHYTTCIAFDFDAKRNDPEAVVEEVTRLKNHLYDRHGEVVIDRSLNGWATCIPPASRRNNTSNCEKVRTPSQKRPRTQHLRHCTHVREQRCDPHSRGAAQRWWAPDARHQL